MSKTIIVCSRDLDYGIGTQCKYMLKTFDEDQTIEKVYFIGPRHAHGYSPKIISQVIPIKGKYFITKVPLFAFYCNETIKRLISKNHIDLITLHSSIMAEDYGIKTEATFHALHKSIIQNFPKTPTYLIATAFHLVFSYFDKKTIQNADKVYFVSDKILTEAKRFYPDYQAKFHLKSNTVDRSLFYPLSEIEKQKVKENLGLADHKKNILYVGRLDPFKGILDLIQIIIKLDDPFVRLLIIGDGSLAGHVQHYPFVKHFGQLDHEKLNKFYNIADVFVFPSKNESYGLALMEAIYCKTPVVAFKPDGKKYLTASDAMIKHGENGFLVKDEQEMLETIRFLIKCGRL